MLDDVYIAQRHVKFMSTIDLFTHVSVYSEHITFCTPSLSRLSYHFMLFSFHHTLYIVMVDMEYGCLQKQQNKQMPDNILSQNILTLYRERVTTNNATAIECSCAVPCFTPSPLFSHYLPTGFTFQAAGHPFPGTWRSGSERDCTPAGTCARSVSMAASIFLSMYCRRCSACVRPASVSRIW